MNGARPPGIRLRILLAEDVRVNQKLVLRLLEPAPYQVDVAQNGHEVLARLQADSYDLILMDCQMPGMNGLEATRAIRAAVAPYRRIPIIGLSAGTFDDEEAEARAAGMDDFLPKPLERSVFLALLETWATRLHPEGA